MKKLLLLFTTLSIGASSFSQSTFSVTTTGTNAQINSAIDYATNLWSQYLNSTVPIKLNIIYTFLGPGTKGVTIPNGEFGFMGAPNPNVVYPYSLANSITSTELNVGEADMDIYMNSSINWYFGTDGNPGTQHDFVSTLMHEIIHGLGGLSFSKVQSGEGSFGMLTNQDIPPVPLSFTIEFTPGVHTIWDEFIVNGNNLQLADSTIFQNQSIELANEIQSNNIYFSGINATTANGGIQPRIYAPANWSIGSSIHHLNETTYPSGSGNEMFTPNSGAGQSLHSPGPMLLGMLKDIGWDVNLTVGLEDDPALKSTHIYPNPSNGKLTIDFNQKVNDLKVIDVLGNIVSENLVSGLNDLSYLENGTYIITGTVDGEDFTERFIIAK